MVHGQHFSLGLAAPAPVIVIHTILLLEYTCGHVLMHAFTFLCGDIAPERSAKARVWQVRLGCGQRGGSTALNTSLNAHWTCVWGLERLLGGGRCAVGARGKIECVCGLCRNVAQIKA